MDHLTKRLTLQGTGPWNLDVQVVGPKGSEIIKIPKIETNRKTLQIPIPPIVDKEGGSFEIDLGMSLSLIILMLYILLSSASVEDAYGCKRAVSVPGVVVNVRRVKVREVFSTQSESGLTLYAAYCEILWRK